MKPYSDRARGREHAEPAESDRPVPKPVLFLLVALFGWGLYYIGAQVGAPLAGGDSRTPVVAAAAADGATVYAANCAVCHQATGQGLTGAFPPLVGSEWVQADPAVATAIVLHGLHGPIEVAGKTYQGVMPAFGGQFSDAEVAAVVSYIRTSWGNDAGEIDAEQVSELRSRFGDHPAWEGGQLQAEFGEP